VWIGWPPTACWNFPYLICLPAYASEFYKLRDGERRELVLQAIGIVHGRLPIVARVNHVSTDYVADTAREFEHAGAAAIAVAVPRVFSLPERDLLRYFDRILQVLTVPLIIQDFNPGGATVSLEFVKTLSRRHHPHFRYLKLEEPLMAERVRSIIQETNGTVGVIEGWGGAYMLELVDAGICGVMSGLAVSDLLQIVWNRARAEDKDAAYELFQRIQPQITYSLQNLEFFHHGEKALLVAGRPLRPGVRDATLTLHEVDRAHIDFLNRKILDLVKRIHESGHNTQ
jgi:2-keto-3-deoxy-L-arabinonate dehydratase